MSNIVHDLLGQYRKDPVGIEKALNAHINNVAGSAVAGGRWAAYELAVHEIENYPDEALEKLKKLEIDWKKIALMKTKRRKGRKL